MIPAGPVLTWYQVELGVLVAGTRVAVATSMLAVNAEEVHGRCEKIATGMSGRVADTKITIGNPIGGERPPPVAGYLPPPCTYKADPPPDKIVFDPADGWEEYKDVSPGASAFLGGPGNDKAAS